MKKKILIAALMLMAPVFSFAQGKGHSKGHGNGNKNGHYKAEKVNAWQGKSHDNVVVVGNNTSKTYTKTTTRVKGGPPPWAPAHGYRAKQHAYFPDYYTFYDANRNGYVYWNNSGWTFSRNVPSFLSGVNLGTSRLELLNDIPLTVHPETYYSRYNSTYPARTVTISVPIPR